MNKLASTVFALLLLCVAAAQAAMPTIVPERMRNLKMLDANPFLFQYHRITTGEGRQFFAYPQRDTTFRKNFKQTEKDASMKIGGEDYAFAASFVGGLDMRGGESIKDTAWPAADAGLFIRGFADSVDFALEARMYVENRHGRQLISYDKEIFDDQSGGDIKYISYSRYRGQMGINWGHFRLNLARDVLHWGPGFYNNLTLNQYGLPYNSVSLDMFFGPLHVLATYGDLRVGLKSWDVVNRNDRNMFAHRYELALGNLTLGMSEIQILYNDLKPWLFVPVVPLFIEKGNYWEHSNNGAMALDFNYRLFGFARIYGEFFLDDLESPEDLLENEMSNNRWAAMAGIQIAHDFTIASRKLETGMILEIARVEPYTYCHYDTAQAQLANLSMPLGNPNGPNSRTIDWMTYARFARVTLTLGQKFYWKGTTPGSSVFDPYKTVHKTFLEGAKMKYSLTPGINYEGQYVTFMGSLTFFDNPEVYLRAGFKW